MAGNLFVNQHWVGDSSVNINWEPIGRKHEQTDLGFPVKGKAKNSKRQQIREKRKNSQRAFYSNFD